MPANVQRSKSDGGRQNEIRDWLIAAVAERTRLSRAEIRVDEPIYRYGIDSLERVNLTYQLECWIGFEVNESTLADLETIAEVAAHLAHIESVARQ
jgi:acyl carrier protein